MRAPLRLLKTKQIVNQRVYPIARFSQLISVLSLLAS